MRRRIATLMIAAALTWAAGNEPPASATPGQDRTAPGPPHVSALTLGELPPTAFRLHSIDGDTYDLAAVRPDQPLLLIFFRGTW